MVKKWREWSMAILMAMVFAGTANAISDAELRDFIDRIDSAANDRDVTIVADALSDAAQIVVDVPTPQGTAKVELDKAQYLKALEQGWNAIGPSYRYVRVSTQIENDGATARIVSIVREEFQVGGQLVGSDTLETLDIAIENGKPVVVRVLGQIQVQEAPAPGPNI